MHKREGNEWVASPNLTGTLAQWGKNKEGIVCVGCPIYVDGDIPGKIPGVAYGPGGTNTVKTIVRNEDGTYDIETVSGSLYRLTVVRRERAPTTYRVGGIRWKIATALQQLMKYLRHH